LERGIRLAPDSTVKQMPICWKKIAPWFAGCLIGGVVAAVLTIVGIMGFMAFKTVEDEKFDLVAVSWGAPMNQDDPWVYQVQVIGDGQPYRPMKVSARVCIGGSFRWLPLGDLGTAKNMGEAQRKFGTITWLSDQVTIGGEDGIKATLLRSKLDGD
jgi:hypothetical protein